MPAAGLGPGRPPRFAVASSLVTGLYSWPCRSEPPAPTPGCANLRSPIGYSPAALTRGRAKHRHRHRLCRGRGRSRSVSRSAAPTPGDLALTRGRAGSRSSFRAVGSSTELSPVSCQRTLKGPRPAPTAIADRRPRPPTPTADPSRPPTPIPSADPDLNRHPERRSRPRSRPPTPIPPAVLSSGLWLRPPAGGSGWRLLGVGGGRGGHRLLCSVDAPGLFRSGGGLSPARFLRGVRGGRPWRGFGRR